jgi:hypothetical protein
MLGAVVTDSVLAVMQTPADVAFCGIDGVVDLLSSIISL